MNCVYVLILNARVDELYVCLLVNPVRMLVPKAKRIGQTNYKELNIGDRIKTTTL
jgi:hypothetical protein